MDEANEERLYKEACALVNGLILLDDIPNRRLSAADRVKLEKSLPLFEKVIALNLNHWPALWLKGKVHQRLEAFELGLECFAAAHAINPKHPEVAREAAIAAMDSGQPERAILFCERAIAANPHDAGLRANLALALLFSGRPSESAEVADDALRRSPTDAITSQIASVVHEVLGGARPCPRHVRDLS